MALDESIDGGGASGASRGCGRRGVFVQGSGRAKGRAGGDQGAGPPRKTAQLTVLSMLTCPEANTHSSSKVDNDSFGCHRKKVQVTLLLLINLPQTSNRAAQVPRKIVLSEIILLDLFQERDSPGRRLIPVIIQPQPHSTEQR